MSDGYYYGPILDSHHHLWDLSGNHYPWLRPEGDFGPTGLFDSIKHDYKIENYRQDSAAQNIVGTVHIEALWDPTENPVRETEWLDSLDKSDNIACRYVAGVPFSQQDTAEILNQQTKHWRVAGVRQTIAWHPDPTQTMVETPHLALDTEWRKGVGLVNDKDLALDLLIYPWQADEVVDLAKAFPSLRIVVNHIASPNDQTEKGLSAWGGNIEELATEPNIYIKISSVHSYLVHPTLEHVEFFVQRILNAFNHDNIMIGSDFPPGGMKVPYETVMKHYRICTRGLPLAEQFKIFCGNALRVYKIDRQELDIPNHYFGAFE